jgi:hypothetical protein
MASAAGIRCSAKTLPNVVSMPVATSVAARPAGRRDRTKPKAVPAAPERNAAAAASGKATRW